MIITTIETLEGRKWVIEHNLHRHGLEITNGFINWHFRTDDEHRTPENFCAYLMSKDPTNLKAKFIEAL